MARIPFAKPAIAIVDQLQKLTDRGLIVGDPAAAMHYLEWIGYYRLSGYTLPFQFGDHGVEHHKFKPGTTFEDVLDCYIFDRKIRLLLLDAIERIEVAIRAALSNSIAVRHTPHWYRDAALYDPAFEHGDYIDEIQNQIGHRARTPDRINKRAVFIRHYYDTYSDPDMPPSWMVFENVSFGVISKTIEGLLKSECREICAFFGIQRPVLSSWLHAISYVRNLCAHHARIWNRTLTIKPMIARRFKSEFPGNSQIYAIFVVIQILLGKVAPDNHWAVRLKQLFDEHSKIPLIAMGIEENWHDRPIWGLAGALER